MTVPATWHAICQSPDVPAALFRHFEGALATSDANRELLGRVVALASSARIDTSREEQHHLLEVDFGADKLRCFKPRDADERAIEVPPSYARILDLHARLQLVEGQVDLFRETYVEDEGWLAGTGLEGREVFCPLRVYADIYIYHPDDRAPNGEPALYFLDHVMVDEDGPQRSPADDIASLFLQHVAKCLQLRR